MEPAWEINCRVLPEPTMEATVRLPPLVSITPAAPRVSEPRATSALEFNNPERVVAPAVWVRPPLKVLLSVAESPRASVPEFWNTVLPAMTLLAPLRLTL